MATRFVNIFANRKGLGALSPGARKRPGLGL